MIASWEGCRIDDPRLDEFRSRLISPHAKEPRLIDSVQTTKDILRALTEPPLSISSKQAHSRLEGILIGQDGTAAIMVRFTAYGLEHQAESMVLIYKLADDVPGLGGTALRMAGTVWRVTVKVSALTNDDYGTLTNRVQASVNAVLNESDSNAIALTEFTGLSPVMHETQKMLLKDLGASFTTAFLLLGPLGLCLMPRNGLK